MNSEQLEELEALGYIFTAEEMQVDRNVFEFVFSDFENLKFQVIWPEDYPCSPLLVYLLDSRVPHSLKELVESDCKTYAESQSGTASTFSLVNYIKENIERWEILNKFCQAEEAEESKSEKKTQLSKAQKRKMYKHMDGTGERQRGWNWVDIVSHVMSS